jgi:RNA polymerase sigma-70 factor (ECF subfamily)
MATVRAAHQRSELEGRLRLLMIRSLNGDSQAYRRLLGELSGYLRSYFARRISEREVEGLVQETLLVMHLKRDSYDRELPFTPWACAIARYKLADYFRRHRASRIAAEDAGDLFAGESPERDV